MVGLAAELGRETRLANYGRDCRDGKAFRFEDRALFDVYFDETEHIRIERCFVDFVGFQAEGANRVG
jgi:hypothetical protein